jgi:putative Mn2+ efflux pump MntP
MNSYFLPAFYLSLDSFIVALAVSPLISAPRARLCFATVFGLGDGLAVLIGFALKHAGFGFHLDEKFYSLIAAVYGLYFMAAALWKQFRVHPRLVYFLPALMSLDNLTYGLGLDLGATDVGPRAFALGLASLALAALGLMLGGLVHFIGVRASQLAAGVGLLTAAVVFSLT